MEESYYLPPLQSRQDTAPSRYLSAFPRPAIFRLKAYLFVPVGFGALWLVLCRHLSIEWSGNEQYSYGWFVPFFALYLLWMRWETRPAPEVPGRMAPPGLLLALAGIVLLLVLPIRLFETAAPDWRPVVWLHALLVVALTLAAVYHIGGKSWTIHFAFPVAFILVAVPWIAGIEVAVVQGLMQVVAGIAAEGASLIGIPARLEGNLLRLRTGLVGVNEACSGVRSLQTSLMIGLLFGELNRFNVLRRIALVAAAAAIAFAANVCRAVFLVWVAANRGIAATDEWHDTTGYSIVILVFVGTLAVAALLSRGKPAAAVADEPANVPSRPSDLGYVTSKLPVRVLAAALVWLIAAEVAVESWYRYHERNHAPTVPWTVRWPESAPGFRAIDIDERVRGILRFDEGRAAAWRLDADRTPPGDGADGASEKAAAPLNMSCVLYFFRWDAGRSSILRARGHRPDICLPSAGWEQTADSGTRLYSAGEISLPFRHFEFVHQQGSGYARQVANAFFCVAEDRITPNARGAETVQEINEMQGFSLIPHLWRLVANGERPRAQQVMQVLLMGPKPVAPGDVQQLVDDLVESVVVPRPAS